MSLSILKDFRVIKEIEVMWTDMDIYNHINNSIYFRYFEASRLLYFEQLDIYAIFKENRVHGVLSKVSCSFIVSISYPSIINVGTKVVEVNKELIIMEHFIINDKQQLCAIGESEIVFVDNIANRKAQIPGSLIDKINQFENNL
jgi:acyl-CoA thioester hydrolase